jgi:hypothetical protein
VRIYADHPDYKARQIIGDVLAVVAMITAVPAGRALFGWLNQHGEAGHSLNESSQALATNLHDTANQLDGIPLVGGTVAEPLRNAGDSASSIAEAGASLEDFVSGTSTVASLGLVAAIIAIALFGWFLPRWRWMQNAAVARTAARSDAGLDFLALRALAAAPAPDIDTAGHALLAGWREGDPEVIARLADVELARLGLATYHRK